MLSKSLLQLRHQIAPNLIDIFFPVMMAQSYIKYFHFNVFEQFFFDDMIQYFFESTARKIIFVSFCTSFSIHICLFRPLFCIIGDTRKRLHHWLVLWWLNLAFQLKVWGSIILSTNKAWLRPIHPKNFLAVIIDINISYFSWAFDEVSWIYDRICFILFSLL